jgi:hypothetical protein
MNYIQEEADLTNQSEDEHKICLIKASSHLDFVFFIFEARNLVKTSDIVNEADPLWTAVKLVLIYKAP